MFLILQAALILSIHFGLGFDVQMMKVKPFTMFTMQIYLFKHIFSIAEIILDKYFDIYIKNAMAKSMGIPMRYYKII